MLKHKSLVMVSILVLVLAVVAMSCAPAKPATPPTPPAPPVVAPPVTPPVVTPPVVTPPPAAAIVEVKTSYTSKKFTDDASGVSIAYPEDWVIQPLTPGKLPGTIFYAKGTGKDAIFVAVRPATVFKDAANQYLADLIAASGASFSPAIDNEAAITLADGTKAQQILLSAAFGMAKAATTGFIKDGKAIIVCGNSDPSAKSMSLYKEIGTTLLVK